MKPTIATKNKKLITIKIVNQKENIYCYYELIQLTLFYSRSLTRTSSDSHLFCPCLGLLLLAAPIFHNRLLPTSSTQKP